MKKVQLTEAQLHKALMESIDEINLKHAAAAGLGAAALAGGVAACNHECDNANGYKNPAMSDEVGRYALNSDDDADLYNQNIDSTYNWGNDPTTLYGDKYEDTFVENKQYMSKILRESINKVLNEISADTIDSARDKAFEKYKKLDKTSTSIPRVNHAYHQAEKFSTEYAKRYKEGNEAKRARMDKNREDRDNGTRTYVKGKGWRTNSNNE